MSTPPLRQSQRIAARKAAASLHSSETKQLELQFAFSMKLHPTSPKVEAKEEAKEETPTVSLKEEQCETPERKVGVWSQQLDQCVTAKKEEMPPSQQEPDRFKTPPRRLTIPTLEQLERWDRMERETNRRL